MLIWLAMHNCLKCSMLCLEISSELYILMIYNFPNVQEKSKIWNKIMHSKMPFFVKKAF